MDLWAMISWIQAAEMSFSHRVTELFLRDRLRNSIIWERLRVESLILHIKRSQLRWFGRLVTMPPDASLERWFGHVQQGEDQEADPGHAGKTTSLGCPGNPLVSSWKSSWGERGLGLSASSRGWMDIFSYFGQSFTYNKILALFSVSSE